MSLFDAMTIASTSLTAQTAKLNTVTQNLANANTVASSAEEKLTAPRRRCLGLSSKARLTRMTLRNLV